MDDLQNRMMMALVAADFDRTIIEAAASVCVEIARQYCEELHPERVGVLPGR
jgi:phosphoserine phosphatase